MDGTKGEPWNSRRLRETAVKQRRNNVRKVIWAILVLMLASAGLVGCGDSSRGTASGTPAATASGSQGAVPTAKTGGTVVYGTLFEPATLNPLQATDVVSKWAVELIFDGLVYVNDKMEMKPGLATEWSTSPDGLEWTFKLRNGVRWHDGVPFTADDVRFTYETVLNKDTKTIPKTDYASIARIETPDLQTVRFYLKEKSAPFLSKLATNALAIVPKHILENQDLNTTDFNRKPIGTGPFVVEEWAQGQKLSVKANPNYFGTKPALDKIIWKKLTDSNVLSLQLLNGEVDGAAVNPEIIGQVKANNTLSTYETVDANTYIGFQLDNPLFQDKRVRQALSYGLDRDAILTQILKGQGIRSTSHIMPNSWAYNPDVEKFGFNQAKAKQLLADAGWKPGPDGVLTKDGQKFKFTLLTNAGDKTREAVSLFVRQQWGELGVQVEPQYLDLNTFIQERVLKRNFEAILLSGSVNVDPDYLYRNFHSKAIGTANNFLSYRNDQVDKLLEEGQVTLDQQARQKIYFEIQKLMADDAPQVPLYYPKVTYAFKKTIQGINPSPINLFWNAEAWHY